MGKMIILPGNKLDGQYVNLSIASISAKKKQAKLLTGLPSTRFFSISLPCSCFSSKYRLRTRNQVKQVLYCLLLFFLPARDLSMAHQMTPPANVLITTTILLHKPGQKLCIFVGEGFITTTTLLQSLCLQHAQHHLRRSMLVDAAAFRNSNKSASSLVQANPVAR